MLVKPDHRRRPAGEQGEAAGDETGIAAIGPHGLDQRPATRREGDARGDDFVDDTDREVPKQGDAFAERGLEGDLPFMARSVMAETSAFRPT